jgi:hypothetical protein
MRLGDSLKRWRERHQQRKSSTQPEDMQQPTAAETQNRSSSHTPPPGLSGDAGSQSTTLKLSPQLPSTLSSVQDRRQQNLQNERWRNGFGSQMILVSSAFNKKFGIIDLELWSMALAEYDLEDLYEGFAEFMKSPEGFPTPGKAEKHIKKCRQHRLGIVVR